jgi:hypothetical protein
MVFCCGHLFHMDLIDILTGIFFIYQACSVSNVPKPVTSVVIKYYIFLVSGGTSTKDNI